MTPSPGDVLVLVVNTLGPPDDDPWYYLVLEVDELARRTRMLRLYVGCCDNVEHQGQGTVREDALEHLDRDLSGVAWRKL